MSRRLLGLRRPITDTQIKCLVSDLDGTLVDILDLVWRSHYEVLTRTLEAHGLRHLAPRTLRQFIHGHKPYLGKGPHAELTFAIDLYAPGLIEAQGIEADELVKLLNEIQDELAPMYLTAFDGLHEFLLALGRRRMSLAILTSGIPSFVIRSFAYALRADVGVADLYDRPGTSDDEKLNELIDAVTEYYSLQQLVILTRLDVTKSKPSPEGAQKALSLLGCEPSEAAFLGDHHSDMRAARGAKILRCIAIRHHRRKALCSARQLRKAGATHIVHTFTQARRHIGCLA